MYNGTSSRDIADSYKATQLRTCTIVDSVHGATSRLAALLILATISSVSAALVLVLSRHWASIVRLRARRHRLIRSIEQDVAVYADGEPVAGGDLDRRLDV